MEDSDSDEDDDGDGVDFFKKSAQGPKDIKSVKFAKDDVSFVLIYMSNYLVIKNQNAISFKVVFTNQTPCP